MQEEEFDILKKLQRVESPDYLYGRILKKIELEKGNYIPFYKVAAAACLILACTAFELTLVKKSSVGEFQSYESILVNENSLYYE